MVGLVRAGSGDSGSGLESDIGRVVREIWLLLFYYVCCEILKRSVYKVFDRSIYLDYYYEYEIEWLLHCTILCYESFFRISKIEPDADTVT